MKRRDASLSRQAEESANGEGDATTAIAPAFAESGRFPRLILLSGRRHKLRGREPGFGVSSSGASLLLKLFPALFVRGALRWLLSNTAIKCCSRYHPCSCHCSKRVVARWLVPRRKLFCRVQIGGSYLDLD